MTTSEPIDETAPRDDAWREIERLLGEISELAKSDVSADEFYRQLLDHTTLATAAQGGAVWLCDREGRFHLEHQIHLESTGLVGREQARTDHGRLLGEVTRDGRPRAVPPRSGREDARGNENPTDLLLLLCPVRVDGRPLAVIEIFQRGEIHPATQRGNLRLLDMVAELAADFHRGRELSELRLRETTARQLDDFAIAIHRHLDLPSTAFAIANEARPVLHCDRVSVAVAAGAKYRLLAISGVDTLDRRGKAVRLLEQLAAVVGAFGEPLRYTDGAAELPPQIERVLQSYVDEVQVRRLTMVPLEDKSRDSESPGHVGMLIVEHFTIRAASESSRTIDHVCRHASIALSNAATYGRTPLLPVVRAVGWVGRLFGPRRLPKLLALLSVCALIVALLVFVPADFTIKVPGELQPLERRHVFAPHDAVVSQVLVEHNDRVSARQTLAQLHSPELELEIQRVRGEHDQTRQRLVAVTAEKLQASKEGRDAAVISRLTSQEEELKQQSATQLSELNILQQQRKVLDLESPIAGRVLTWRTEQLLHGRPVRKGQALMTVANVDGPWILELHVPDDDIGHVHDGYDESGGDQSLSFILATTPDEKYQGRVREIAGTVSSQGEHAPSVLVTADVDRDAISLLRPGASVVARIHCGRRPVGYVWFRGLYEAIRKKVLF